MTPMMDFASARANMVNGQLLTNGIANRDLVAAYGRIPREVLVGPALASRAYLDEDVRVAKGRWMLEPLVEARLIEAALGEGSPTSALILGAASLPTVAMLARFVAALTVIEPDASLAAAARARLSLANVTIVETGLREGYARQAPYDLVLVPGSMASVPKILLDQLVSGGALVTVLRPNPTACGKITVMRRDRDGDIATRHLADAATPYLPEFTPESRFAFQ